jgi:alpha-tubulin suppressor-like RCC1 family protein
MQKDTTRLFALLLALTLLLDCYGAANAVTPQVAAGYKFAVGLNADGRMFGWGSDGFGQLGLGTTAVTTTPQVVPGFNLGQRTGKPRVAAGESYYVAMKSDGSVWAWGQNDSGQLGDGTTMNRSTPVEVPGLTGVVAVAAGWHHSLAVKSDGSVWAWGANDAGQLGDRSTMIHLRPVQVSGLTGVAAAAAESIKSYAVKSDGSVWSWGANESNSPVQIAGLAGVAAVAPASDHVLVRMSNGSVWAWGNNQYGQLGDGTTTTRSSPMPVPGLAGVVAVAAGLNYSIAVTIDGSIWAWGYNISGQLGDGTTTNRSTPVRVTGLTDMEAAVAGRIHALALKADGSVWAWGTNQNGQLGDISMDGRHSSVVVPEQVPGLSGAVELATGSITSLAVKADGSVWTWGSNAYGLLGDGRSTYRFSPVPVPGLTGAVAVAAGGYHGMALKSDGTVWTWGYNFRGQLGYGQVEDELYLVHTSPARVPGLTDVVAVTAGNMYSMAVKSDGSVWAWGDNDTGQLGDGDATISRLGPVQVVGLANVVTAVAGGGAVQASNVSAAHSLAIKSDGSVWAWGNNAFGQLGNGTTTSRSTPIQVPGLAGVVAATAGEAFSIAVKSDGSVWTWGLNPSGQLGDGTTTNRSSPVQVPGLTGVVAVGAGAFHSLAVKSDGSVWAWGQNDSGQLGDGTTFNHSTPVQVPGLTGVVKVEAGWDDSFAVKSDGSIWAWGANDISQLGDGTTANRSSPVQIFEKSGVATDYVVESYNTVLDNYFITADPNEAAAIDNGFAGPGWVHTNGTFKSGGSTPVCRFYGSLSPGPNSHFYTLSGAECDSLRQIQASTPATQKRWNFESLDFVSTPVSNGACPAGTVPVYRAYNNGFARGVDSNHRISASQAAIAQVVARGWISEGVVMCAPA